MASVSTTSSSALKHFVVARSYQYERNEMVYALSTPFRIAPPFAALTVNSSQQCPPVASHVFSPITKLNPLANPSSLCMQTQILCQHDPNQIPRELDSETLEKITDVHVRINLPPLTYTPSIDNKWAGLAGAIGSCCNKIFPNLNLDNSTMILYHGPSPSVRNELFLFTDHSNASNTNLSDSKEDDFRK